MIVRWLAGLATLSVAVLAQGAMTGQPGATVPSLLVPASVGRPATPPPRTAAPSAPRIHPAVVRVVAPGRGSVSYGSGTLVDVKGDYGLVITNYHVINEATGNVSVVFPDGFYSLATVRKVDRDWDLAALVIKRPSVQPVTLANAAPRPGEPLTIAGYGAGNYRAVAGRCTQYVAPGTRMPFEMVELAASARQGDSGGPILNSRGELAGVLFGEGGGRTAGSYCGRVKWFLASLTDRPNPPRATPAPTPNSAATMVAERDTAPPPLVPLRDRDRKIEPDVVERPAGSFAGRTVQTPANPFESPLPRTGFVHDSSRPSLEPAGDEVSWAQIAGDTFADQIKTFLAILGCCAVLMFALKAIGGGK